MAFSIRRPPCDSTPALPLARPSAVHIFPHNACDSPRNSIHYDWLVHWRRALSCATCIWLFLNCSIGMRFHSTYSEDNLKWHLIFVVTWWKNCNRLRKTIFHHPHPSGAAESKANNYINRNTSNSNCSSGVCHLSLLLFAIQDLIVIKLILINLTQGIPTSNCILRSQSTQL